MSKQYVYSFDEVKNANSQEWIFRLGNKGAQLAEMTASKLPVPQGFTITTEACNQFYENGKKWPHGLEPQVKEKLERLEKHSGKELGGKETPLFLSVRSGSYVSMPGMMDTVLNLGMNDKTVEVFAKKTGNERVAFDSYRRFITMFGDVVMGVKHALFEEILDEAKETKGVKFDTELDASDLKALIPKYKALVRREAGKDFPQDPWEQLKMAIDAVFGSWNTPRAVSYRRINNLRNDAGTGVNVQAMVFGNMGESSGTGVSFTRNPATGKKEHYGEFLINAQGEDVVAGIRTPKPIDELKAVMPDVYGELLKVYEKLEKHYKDLQDFEFTIENKKLYLLQTRNGKRTAQAAVKIAVDMEEEGLLSREEAILKVKPEQLDQLLHKQLDPVAKDEAVAITKGLPASPGAAVGKVVFTAEKAKELHDADHHEQLILVRTETSPEDIEGMNVAKGILTARGGMTSHAAVVARGMGKCCVAGAGDINVKEKEGYFTIKDLKISEGQWISLDGGTGEVFEGQIPLIEPEMKGDFATLMKWADSFRRLKIKTNADTPKDAKVALGFGAEGIGLVRTEHMFFEGERIKAVREMILSENLEGRKKALAKLLPFQKDDFAGIFEVMDKLPVVIRLLDPPLHEFLPKEGKDIAALSDEMGVNEDKLRETIDSLHEFNPMLGFRGCRLGVVYPEINEMQVRAIFEAALQVKEKGTVPKPWIEVPLVGNIKEFLKIKALVKKVARETGAEGRVDYKVGTMVEVPRAALTADEIAKEAEFLSFGTNDLTQMTCGFSRDDAGKFLKHYTEMGIYERDPFQSIDQEGVGLLMQLCVEKARSINPEIEIGICGEHGGEPKSVEFCHKIGLNDVSCSPFRVPIARLAAAQAAVKEKLEK
ncbi:MAG: pyruvate, phosphate dikinase [Candidatus Diapherotrites archaeon]|uniref:pyruvate, phosphate dikinase n=1 Tax=Candidatus Iainarchaeum sp. TaxID=3101447 RepID=A0A938YSF9_9ARCH|nr:pyruvate, phosphate dikinase [Candidatus Diapherotrites archaeon]